MEVTYTIETHGEDDFEIAEFNFERGDMTSERCLQIADELEEVDPAMVVGVNPETEMINELEEGCYEYVCDVDLDTFEHTTLSSRKLSDSETEKLFTDVSDIIPEFKVE